MKLSSKAEKARPVCTIFDEQKNFFVDLSDDFQKLNETTIKTIKNRDFFFWHIDF